MKLFKDILTGYDRKTYDHSRLLCILSFFVYYAMALGSIIVDKPWSPLDFSAGIATMAVGFGVNYHLKRDSDPR